MTAEIFRCGWAAIIGPPNAGKSTLLNALLGQKLSIVTPKAQTTRNRITGILTDANSQVIFMDTPGIHQARGKMNRILTQTVWQAVNSADVLLPIVDAELYVRKPEYLENDVEPMIKAIKTETRPVLVIANKVDLIGDKSRLLPLLQTLHVLWPHAEIFPVSALHKAGLPELLHNIISAIPEGPAQFPEEQISTMPLRFMAAEAIREQLFLTLRQELPYSVAVDIDTWTEEPERNLTCIHSVIYVARSSHKAIVIGKNGRNLKAIGQAARKEIAEILGTRVHLELWVKIREDWPEDLGVLRTHELGLDGRNA